ncbi:hypothetical protein PF008_g27122 [Phytophthora fragariae]|uniref:Uncharacterized protein n=1 Tax=Phytophthora fragariae TaxID=53985 RepID=A0A6G0QF38_9STRA|nr:hypothetical protein PF008_g27122 [Phytophthora fragariae]
MCSTIRRDPYSGRAAADGDEIRGGHNRAYALETARPSKKRQRTESGAAMTKRAATTNLPKQQKRRSS